MPFPPEKRSPPRRTTSATDQAGFQDASAAASLANIEAALADPATETTLAAVLAKLTSDPATQTTLAAILAKIIAAPATETTVAAILAKIIAAPATSANQDTIIAAIGDPTDTEWDGSAASASAIAILKAIWIKLP